MMSNPAFEGTAHLRRFALQVGALLAALVGGPST